MPYIEQSDRLKYQPTIALVKSIFELNGITPGELNYLITMLAYLYLERKGLNYTHLNDIVGVLESAKAEFQRKVVSKYEDEKAKSNGEVP